MERISWGDFERAWLVAGTIVRAEAFPEARKPAWKLWIDFGEHGVLTSSAQITDLYPLESLMGRQVVGVINFEPKSIAGFRSQALVTGFADSEGRVVLAVPERPVPNGSRLF